MSGVLSFAATEAALRDGVVARVAERAVVLVEGPEARSYLQGQVSQDVSDLAPGDGREALVLSPQGKLEAYVRVASLAPERFVLDVDPAFGDALFDRLRRFKLRVKATLELATWRLVMLRGERAAATVAPGLRGDGVVLAVEWPGWRGVDVLGPTAEVPPGVDLGDESALEVARIEAGVPVMGHELVEGLIAPQAGIVSRTVSFTKGCYTGQELIARLDARGNRVPELLRRVALEQAGDVAVGEHDPLFRDGKHVGDVTSAAYSVTTGRVVALAYLRREVEPPSEVTLVADGRELRASVEPLPGS